MAEPIHPIQTHMRLHAAEDWPVRADFNVDRQPLPWTIDAEGYPVASLRRIGWLDQKGRVWVDVPSTAVSAEYGCGSFTPLLIDPGERG